MDAITNFKQAAKVFQEDERYLALAKARELNDSDEELQKMIGDFNLIRLELNNEMTKEEQDENRMNELNMQVNDLYNKIMANESMVAYNQAKEDIEKFLEYVNAILNAAIDGQDPMEVEEPQSDCGGSCSSCAGCH